MPTLKPLGTALLLLIAGALHALTINGLTDANHICGNKIKPADLNGKAVAIEHFGVTCPPCIASLPHLGKVAERAAKTGKGIVIASHAWSRSDEAIKELMKRTKCDVPTYQRLSVPNDPKMDGVPTAFVYGADGNLVWSGHPASPAFELNFFKAIAKAPGSGSIPGAADILGSLTPEHCKGIAKRLIPGRNIEPALMQLKSRIARGDEAATEARTLLDAVNAWTEKQKADIAEQLKKHPSKALDTARTFIKTMPSQSLEFNDVVKKLAADAEVRALSLSRAALDRAKTAAAKTKTAAALKRLRFSAKSQLTKLEQMTSARYADDVAEVKALWQALLNSLSEEPEK